MFVDPAVVGDVLYIGSCSGRLFALDAASGEVRWAYDTAGDGAPGQFHGQLLITDDLVVAGTDAPRRVGHLYAIERDGGEARWKLPFPVGVAVDVLLHDEDVLFVSEVGDVGRVRLADGEWVWHTDGAEGLDEAAELPGRRLLDPVLAGDRFLVPWRSGHVDAYAVADGRRLWRRDLGARINASPVRLGDGVVLGTFDGRLLRLRLSDGEVVAEMELGGTVYGDLVAASDCLFALSAHHGGAGAGFGRHVLSCIERDLEGVTWQHSEDGEWGTFRPFVSEDLVIAGVEDRLVALDTASGELRWERPIRGLPRGLTVAGDRLYVGTMPGPVFAFPMPAPGREEPPAAGQGGGRTAPVH